MKSSMSKLGLMFLCTKIPFLTSSPVTISRKRIAFRVEYTECSAIFY